MKKKLIIFSILFLVVVNISTLATIAYKRWICGRRFSMMNRPERPIQFLGKKLGLNAEQMRQFKFYIQEFDAETKTIFDSLRQKDARLIEEVMANEPDSAKINKLIKEIGQLQISFKQIAFSYLLKKRSLLTPEQQRKFIMFIQKRRAQGMMGFRGSFISEKGN